MSCKVVHKCIEPNYNHYNPLISSLLDFHGRILKTADSLPEEGKVAELCKRIGYIIAAPIAYLVLAFVHLAGILTDSFWENKHIKEIEAIEKEKIESIPPEMLQALGGVEKALNLPRIVNWNGQHDSVKHPIAFSLDKPHGQPMLLFNTRKAMYAVLQPTMMYLQTGVDVIQWDKNTGTWRFRYPKTSELGLGCPKEIKKGSLEEKFMLERITRLVKGEPVGKLMKYTNKNNIKDPVDTKPVNKDEFRPTDSYLKGEELEQYLDIDTLFYEVEVPKGLPTTIELNKSQGNLLELKNH